MVGYEDAKAIAKDVATVLKKAGEIETQKRFLELEEDRIELRRENIELKEQIKALEERLKLQGSLQFDGTVYWMVHDDGKKEEWPYCPCCYDVNSKLVHLHRLERRGRWICKHCRKGYG